MKAVNKPADAGKQDVEVYNIAPGSGFGQFVGILGTPGTTLGDTCGGNGELAQYARHGQIQGRPGCRLGHRHLAGQYGTHLPDRLER